MKIKLFSLLATLLLILCSVSCTTEDTRISGKQISSGRHSLALTVDGLARTYVVQVPRSYNANTPFPLVVMLHGGGGTANAAMWETGWADKADKTGFLAAFPNAMPPDPTQPGNFARNPPLWNDGSDRFYVGQKAPDDVHFIDAMLTDLSSRFNVDTRRIFITGFSNGASMSFRIGAELSQRIAAIAPVAGACWLNQLRLERPVPMLYITGNADPLNKVEGGVPRLASGASGHVRAKAKPPVRDSIMKWAKAINAASTPTSISETNGVHTEIYDITGNGAEVVYLSIDALGHTWAGGKSLLPASMVGATSDKINATDVIWDFFKKHPREP